MSSLNEPPDGTSLLTTEEPLRGLQPSKVGAKLNQIDLIRATGVGDHISLPQLVVCGDQSAGKSSVLEGITGIPFPRKDGVCTKFATEIILRHSSSTTSIKATVTPHGLRDDAAQAKLKSYSRKLDSFSELPDIIEEVASLMGIRNTSDNPSGPAFAADILRIEYTGNTGLRLTVIDLPGLIAVHSDDQTEEDVQIVASLVDSYLESPRTIILAVVQANNDIANQGIIQRARRFDKNGDRTVGILTKPDLINEGTEDKIALLARNKDSTKLKLGYFLTKNPPPLQLENGISSDARNKYEMAFFRAAPWKDLSLDYSRVGIVALRVYLQSLLEHFIEKEMPKVQCEINQLLQGTEEKLAHLGEDRPTINHQRTFLITLSMDFFVLTNAALDGNYHGQHASFFETDLSAVGTNRLRAQVHQMNKVFSDNMRRYSVKREIVDNSEPEDSAAAVAADDSEGDTQHGRILCTQKQFLDWVKSVYRQTRGKELPGTYNHVLMSELFHEQSSRWESMAKKHVQRLADLTASYLESALDYVIKDDQVREQVGNFVRARLEQNTGAAMQEVQSILKDESQQPITYNHYYTDNIQKERQQKLHKMLDTALKKTVEQDFNGRMHISNTLLDMERLTRSLQSRIIVDMDEQACAEAISGLKAYYKVAMKTFVDNICRQVIERHILGQLASLFAPHVVAALGDEELARIAKESEFSGNRRKELMGLAEALRSCALLLRA